MKKTLLALAVPAALAAGSANAAINLYNANDVTVDVGGSAEVQYFKDTNDTLDPTLRIDDGDFLINTTVKVAPGLSAIGAIGFLFEDNGKDKATVESDELYVGLASNFGTVTYGRQYTIADDIGNGKDYELGIGYVSYGDTLNSRVIKWSYDNGGMFYAGLSTILDSDVAPNTNGKYAYDGLVGMRYGGFDVRLFGYAGYNMDGSFAPNTATTTYVQDITGFNLEVDYAYQAFDFALGFGLVNFEAVGTRTGASPIVNPVNSGENEAMSYHVAVGYQADPKTYFAAGFYMLETDESGSNYQKYEEHSFYTNVTYALHNNAKVYAEIGIADREIGRGLDATEDPLDDLGYVLGMEVTF